MKIRNRIEPSTDPFGTPLMINAAKFSRFPGSNYLLLGAILEKSFNPINHLLMYLILKDSFLLRIEKSIMMNLLECLGVVQEDAVSVIRTMNFFQDIVQVVEESG